MQVFIRNLTRFYSTKSVLISGILKRVPPESELGTSRPTSPPLTSQDLFSVPHHKESPEQEVLEEKKEGCAVELPPEVSLVPTLEEDEERREEEEEELDTSALKSPLTPGPEIFINEDSMGFDDLHALNIVTPGIESTQNFISLLTKNLSPIKRKCFRTEPEQELLNSTQTYLDLTRHYKLLSEERKRVLYGESASVADSMACSTAAKPLRRRLFDEKDEKEGMGDVEMNCVGLGEDDIKLESFEEEWEKVTVLKPNYQGKEKISRQRVETVVDECSVTDIVSVIEDTDDKLEVPFNVADSLKTPEKQIVKSGEEEILQICDLNVPVMVVEETVCSAEDTVEDTVEETVEDSVVDTVENTVSVGEISYVQTLVDASKAEKKTPCDKRFATREDVIMTDMSSLKCADMEIKPSHSDVKQSYTGTSPSNDTDIMQSEQCDVDLLSVLRDQSFNAVQENQPCDTCSNSCDSDDSSVGQKIKAFSVLKSITEAKNQSR